MPTPEIKQKFVNLACRLSPENLSCDGELPRNEVERRRKVIMLEWGKLEREAGEIVTETRAWSFCS